MKRTHIANGSHHAILAICDRTPVDSFSNRFTKILPGNFAHFDTGNVDNVYITIFYQEGVQQNNPGPLQPVCIAYRVDADQSVIVDLSNQVRNTEYGRIWVDVAGNNHFRQPW